MKTDDIEKSNFNPQMLKSCTDTSYECGYQQGRADAIDECINTIKKCYPREEASSYGLLIWDLEQLKEQKK